MKCKFLHIVMFALVVLSFLSCDKDEPFEYGYFRYDMVTYAGEKGKCSMFTFQSYEDSPLVTLTANNMSRPNMKVGQRLLLNYVVENDIDEASKTIEVKGISKVTTDTIVFVPQEVLDTLKRDEIKVMSVWRTGEYLNIRCQVEYTDKPRQLYLATNGAVDADGVLNTYQIQNLMGAKRFYWLETYLSYYIGPVWRLENVNGLRYNVTDLSYPEGRFFDFKK